MTDMSIAERAEAYGDGKSNMVLTEGEAKLLAQYRLLDEKQQGLVAELLVQLSKSY